MTVDYLLVVLGDLAVKASLVAGGGLVVRIALRRQSAARRHMVGLATVVLLTCLLLSTVSDGYRPWFSAGLTGSNLAGFLTANDFMLEAIGKRSLSDALRGETLLQQAALPVVALWLLGAAAFVLRLCWSIAAALSFRPAARRDEPSRLRRLANRAARDLGMAKAPRLAITSRAATPMAWGPPFSRLVFPERAADWSDQQLRMTLRHELGHIYRIDSLTQVLARMVCSLLWFHPLVWCVKQGLVRDQEEACDDLVVEAGESLTDYARHLLSTFVSSRPVAWTSLHGRRPPISRRIRQLTTSNVRRQPMSRRSGAGLIVVAVVAWLGFISPLLSGSPGQQPAGAMPLTSGHAGQLVDVLTEGLRQHDIPGGVIVVVRQGETVLSRGVGVADRESDRPVDADRTVFRLGSITKPITALGLLMALEEKGASIDTAVQPFVPDIKVPSASESPVTFRHLLTHTGGFDQLGYNRQADSASKVQRLEAFLSSNLVAQSPPGLISTYDTYGMTLAGLLIEKLSGSRYEDYVRQRVFGPLGMERSGFGEPGRDSLEYAVGYAGRGENMRRQRWEYHHTVPASSANSTGTDMARFMKSLLDDCRRPGGRLLSKAVCSAMQTQQFSNHPRLDGYGFGFITENRQGRRIVQHGGSMDGFSALIYLLPDEETGLFVAYNRETGAVASRVAAALLERFFPADPLPLDPPYSAQLDVSLFEGNWINTLRCHSCQGRSDFYWSADPFEISANESGELIIGGGPARAIGPLLFQRDDGLLIAFRKDGKGRVSHMFIRQSVFERAEEPPAEEKGARTGRYVHPSCPIDCGKHHDRVENRPTVCPVCGMAFVPRPAEPK